jgi:hypothetical protein
VGAERWWRQLPGPCVRCRLIASGRRCAGHRNSRCGQKSSSMR